MSNQILQKLSSDVHKEVHATPNQTHGFDDEDVMAAAVLLHAIVMDVAAPKQLEEVGVDEAKRLAFDWGMTLHNQILKMTGVDTYKYNP